MHSKYAYDVIGSWCSNIKTFALQASCRCLSLRVFRLLSVFLREEGDVWYCRALLVYYGRNGFLFLVPNTDIQVSSFPFCRSFLCFSSPSCWQVFYIALSREYCLLIIGCGSIRAILFQFAANKNVRTPTVATHKMSRWRERWLRIRLSHAQRKCQIESPCMVTHRETIRTKSKILLQPPSHHFIYLFLFPSVFSLILASHFVGTKKKRREKKSCAHRSLHHSQCPLLSLSLSLLIHGLRGSKHK